MNYLIVASPSSPLPAIVAAAEERARFRFLEFFAAQFSPSAQIVQRG